MTLTSPVPAPVTPMWQNPYVEVIRYGFAHRNVGWQQHGDVEQVTDNMIQKNVFKIRGAIAATNYVRFPREVSKANQGLGLTGRYVYIQLRRARGQQATLHLDLLTAKKSALRLSLSTMFTSLRSSGTVLRIPLDVSEAWTTIVVDMSEMLQLHGFNGYSRESYRYLKAVTCCASMNLRNVVTSSTYYTPETIPPNLALPTAHENQFGPFGWIALPVALGIRNTAHAQANERMKRPGVEDGSKHIDFQAVGGDEGDANDDDEFEDTTAVSPMPRSPLPSTDHAAPLSADDHKAVSADTSGTGGPPLSPTSRAAGLIRDREDVLSRADQIMRDAGFSVPSPRRRVQAQQQHNESSGRTQSRDDASSVATARGALSARRFLASEHSDWPDPILSLTRIIGFSTAFPGGLRWIPDAPACVYTSYSTIILREFTADGGGQAKRDFPSLLSHHQHQDVATRPTWATHNSDSADPGEALTDDHEVFLTGHTGEICALEVSPNGILLASAQNTPQCVLRVWDIRRGNNECAIVMKSPTKSVHALAFSKDATAFCCVGMDDHARTQLFVWDSSSLFASSTVVVGAKKLVLRARQTCDFPIHAIAFSPYDTDQLVSCGKENIRFWRVNETRHHLPGSPVILKEYSRGTVFTDVAFDCVYPQFPSNLPRVRPIYVSSSAGSVLVVNYDTREVVCVYKLHDAAINSICVNEGFCVTGSDDKFLRVWPLDFSDFFLEAEHEAPVKGVDISSDGMRVAVGTSNGAIGVLHLADQRYRTVLRSHTQPVSALAPLSDDAFVTSASDGTLRVWNTTTGTQTMEFDVSKDLVTCLTSMPSSSTEELTVAVGFLSGCTRIFSLGRFAELPDESAVMEPRVLHEFQQHQSELCDVQYQSDGKTLYTSANGQQLCMYDVTQGYSPIKMLIADMDSAHGKMCLSRDRRFLAVLQQGRRSVLLLDAVSLCIVRVLTPPRVTHSAASDGHGDLQEITQLIISWNSQELLTLTRTDRLHVFSLVEAQPGGLRSSIPFGGVIHSMPLLGQQGITSLALSPNLKYMATGGSDSSVRVWQCEFGKHKFQRMNQTFRLHAGQGSVRGLVFSSDGRRLIATSDSSSAAFVWRFRGNVSKLPALELQDSAMESRHGQHAHKGDFDLPLDDISNKKEPVSTPNATEVESLKPVEIGELKVSASVANVSWKRLIPAKTDTTQRSLVWSSALGFLISTTSQGRVVVIEKLESGQQHFLHAEGGVERLVLSPSQGKLAIISQKHDFADVYNLEALRQENNQTDGDEERADSDHRFASTQIRVQLPQGLDKFSAAEFSVDAALICISGEKSRLPVLFVVDIHSGGELAWPVNFSSATPVTSIISQSPREFVCAAADARRPLQRLRVPPFALSTAALTLEPAIEASLPSQPQRFCFRDDGASSAFDSGRGGHQQRSRFGVAVDSEAYCYFLDFERQRKLHTMQLLLPSARAKITEIQWVGTNEWQALVTALDDETIAVFSLPTQFAFTSAKMRVAAMDWAQLKRTGRLTSSLVVPFDGQQIAKVLADPLSEAGVVTTSDGATISVNFRTGQRRILHAPPTLQLSSVYAASPRLALNGAIVLTLSGDRRALQCWEPGVGRELARLHVPNTLCACFSVSPFDAHLVAAGYEDGSLRVFDVKEQQLVAQCLLPPASQRGRPPSGGKSREAASATEALSSLKKKQATKRSAMNSPLQCARDDKRFEELHFVGPRCVLAVTTSSRLVLFDLSDVALASEGAADVAEGGGAGSKRPSLPKPNKPKEKTIHYRDITLPSLDRIKGITKAQRTVLQSGSSGADWNMEITSIDVQLLSGRSPAKTQRRHGDPEDSNDVKGSTQPFLIAVKMIDRGRGTSVTVAHVFAGNAIPAGHPVHAEEDVAPCDSWVLQASGRPLFHPSNVGQVVYTVTDDEARQWIEIRDFQAHAVVLRLAVPATVNVTTPLGSCSLMRWHTQGKSTVALIDAAAAARPKPLAIVDLTRRSMMQLNHEGVESGAFALPVSHSIQSDAKSMLLFVASHGTTPGDNSAAGLVVAEITRVHSNAHRH